MLRKAPTLKIAWSFPKNSVFIGHASEIRPTNGERNKFLCSLGVKPLIHQSELGTYTEVVPFQEKSSFQYQGMFKILQ
jgi:hypothetical protein